MGVQRHWRDYTTGHALSAARVTCEFGSAAYSAAMVGIDEHLREVLARHRVDTGLFSPVRGVQPLIERSEEHTSELQSLMRISYAVFCLKKKKRVYIKYKYNIL